MAKRGPKTDGILPALIPSVATLDPHARLAAGILAAAFNDLGSDDPVLFVDALAWLLFDEAPALYLDVLSLGVGSEDILKSILGGAHAIKPTRTKAALGFAERARRDERARAAALPPAAGGAAAELPRIRGQRSPGGERTAKAGRGEV